MGVSPLSGAQASLGVLGKTVKRSYTLAVETKGLYTITGLVYVTGLVGVVTTAITVANTVKLTANPTTGTALDLCTATDLGTTDTPAGNLLSLPAAVGSAMANAIGSIKNLGGVPFYLNAGSLEQITATGADGAIDWYLSYVAVSPDGNVVATTS